MNTHSKLKPFKVYLTEDVGLTRFISQVIIKTKNPSDKIPAKEIYERYLNWCRCQNATPYTKKRFYSNFENVGQIYSNFGNGNKKYFFRDKNQGTR
jgi:hypothetical protein